jgi:hypothetical protein
MFMEPSSNDAALGREDTGLCREAVAGQDLPDRCEFVPFPGAWRRTLLSNASAILKSAGILISGTRVFNAAAFALALTAVEEAHALHRARRSCRSTVALLAVERDHAVRAAFEAIRRLSLMTRIARDVAEEAAYPLHRRLDFLSENLRRAAWV